MSNHPMRVTSAAYREITASVLVSRALNLMSRECDCTMCSSKIVARQHSYLMRPSVRLFSGHLVTVIDSIPITASGTHPFFHQLTVQIFAAPPVIMHVTLPTSHIKESPACCKCSPATNHS